MLVMRRLSALLIGVVVAGSAGASIIYDNGASQLTGGLIGSTIDFPPADNFVLTDGASTITDIHWTGYYLIDPPTDAFTVYIYGDDSGAPGVAPLHTLTGTVQRVNSGNDNLGGFDDYNYVLNIDPLALSANTTYWLSITNDIAPDAWFWSLSDVSAGDANQKAVTAWVELDVELAFQLTNDAVVPEPASMTLRGFGLVAFAARSTFLRAK